MLRKKLILLGAPAVGKTSLIARWVKGIFSEKYIATIGVKIEKKILPIDPEALMLQIWDLQGGSEIKGPFQAYIRGAEGCLFVADGTRPETLQYVLRLRGQILGELGDIPFVLALNKSDVAEDWKFSSGEIGIMEKENWAVFKTSAKSGDGVEVAFLALSKRMLQK